MRRVLVRDVMTAPVVTVRENTPFKELVRTLAEHRISAVPVLDPADHVVGIVSEADLLPKQEYRDEPAAFSLLMSRAEQVSRLKAAADTAGQLMTTAVVTVRADQTVVDAARLMDRKQLKRLPVLDTRGELVGMVSRVDLLTVFLREDTEIEAEIATEVFERTLGLEAGAVTIDVRDGVVALTGTLDDKSHVRMALQLTRRVDGVVDVIDHLHYRFDDTRIP
ncbi:MAG: CBS domain-containing protein [Actinomycetes bacterium]|jgi:CBS domain-containing protein|nr:CBS domain-containing protein [Actinomycetes bacterium]